MSSWDKWREGLLQAEEQHIPRSQSGESVPDRGAALMSVAEHSAGGRPQRGDEASVQGVERPAQENTRPWSSGQGGASSAAEGHGQGCVVQSTQGIGGGQVGASRSAGRLPECPQVVDIRGGTETEPRMVRRPR